MVSSPYYSCAIENLDIQEHRKEWQMLKMASLKSLELRKLMKQQKHDVKKINHPLAKYNSLGNVVCQICDCALKSESLWNTHLQSRKHKESIAALKEKKSVENDASVQRINKKRTLENVSKQNDPEPVVKKSKGDVLPNDFFDSGVSKPSQHQQEGTDKEPVQKTKGILKNAITPTPTPQLAATKEEKPTISNQQQQYPSDKNIDNNVTKPEGVTSESASNRKPSSTSEQLPEGFFDDPKLDAKARNVEYKDPKDEEWEKFQKMIQEETKIAETIQEEEDEESEMLKDMDELNNMKTCLSRVDRLKELIRKKKVEKSKEVKSATVEIPGSNEKDGEESEDEDDDDDDDMFNWRAKMA